MLPYNISSFFSMSHMARKNSSRKRRTKRAYTETEERENETTFSHLMLFPQTNKIKGQHKALDEPIIRFFIAISETLIAPSDTRSSRALEEIRKGKETHDNSTTKDHVNRANLSCQNIHKPKRQTRLEGSQDEIESKQNGQTFMCSTV